MDFSMSWFLIIAFVGRGNLPVKTARSVIDDILKSAVKQGNLQWHIYLIVWFIYYSMAVASSEAHVLQYFEHYVKYLTRIADLFLQGF